MKIQPGNQPANTTATGDAATADASGGKAAPAVGLSADELTKVLRGAADVGEQFFAGFFGAGGVATAAPAKPAYAGPPILGKYQEKRFHENFEKYSAGEQEAFVQLLTNAGGHGAEQEYLMKAVASGHKFTTVNVFAEQIRGKSDEWLHKNLRVTGDAANDKGLKQQWSCSCGPTTAEVIRAELDPIYALTLHRKNKDVTSADKTVDNKDVANQQRQVLEDHDGKAVERDAAKGEGMNLEPALNDKGITRWTQVEYEGHSTKSASNRKEAIAKLDADLADGIPCAMRVSDSKNSGGHFVAVTGVTGTGADKTYIIHDVWDGKTVYVKASDLEKGTINPKIAGWDTMSHLYTSKKPD